MCNKLKATELFDVKTKLIIQKEKFPDNLLEIKIKGTQMYQCI